jgi:hypothetical protein
MYLYKNAIDIFVIFLLLPIVLFALRYINKKGRFIPEIRHLPTIAIIMNIYYLKSGWIDV